MKQENGAPGPPVHEGQDPMIVVAAAVVREGRLLVVSKRAAPDVFYLPGGKPDPGEEPMETLRRELAEELGVRPSDPRPLTEFAGPAVLEGVPMLLTVYEAGIDGPPRPAAEIARMRWVSGLEQEGEVRLAPALTGHVLPLLRRRGLLPA